MSISTACITMRSASVSSRMAVIFAIAIGVASTRSSKRVELVVQLERWEPGREYERLGLDDSFYEILGLRIPLIGMPVAPGRNIAILVEVAARNQLLKARGHHAARALADRLERSLREPHVNVPDDDEDEDR